MVHELDSNSVPALVLGSGLNGLGVARSLGMMGVPVFLADTDMRRAELRTRYAHPLKLSALYGDALLRDLTELGATRFAGQRPVLILTQEHTVRTLAGVQDMLGSLYRWLLPSGELLRTLMHKAGFACLAEQAGLRVPRTVPVYGFKDIEEALDLTFPLVIKPALHVTKYERKFLKAYRIGTPGEARDLLHRILPVLPEIIAQEWIPGNDSEIYFCLQHLSAEGGVEVSFVGRKIRSWPPGTGGTASCIAAEDARELADCTTDFFRGVGMCGLAGMEYKRHAVTGEFIAIEPTVGRTDFQAEVATLNGVNLPYLYYRDVLGKPEEGTPQSERPRKRVIWRDREADRRSTESPEQVVRGWPPGRIRDALWRLSDPAPWFEWRRQRIFHRLHPLIRLFPSLRRSEKL